MALSCEGVGPHDKIGFDRFNHPSIRQILRIELSILS